MEESPVKSPTASPDIAPDMALDMAPDVAPDIAPDMAPDVAPDIVEEATRAADAALGLLREGRYSELIEQAAKWSTLSAPLALLRDEFRVGTDTPAAAGDAVRRLRERVHVLREIEAALHAGYSARGQLETERATRLSAEA